jgi:hypothetical protein
MYIYPNHPLRCMPWWWWFAIYLLVFVLFTGLMAFLVLQGATPVAAATGVVTLSAAATRTLRRIGALHRNPPRFLPRPAGQ